MNTEMRFKWIDFYTKFADKLMDFRHDRPALIQRLRKVYSDINMKFPKLEKDNEPKDIDPFTVFGLFNRGSSDETRKTIIRGLISEFSVNAEVPDDFSGIPVMVMNAAFYSLDDKRGEHDIDTLWNLFSCAVSHSENRGNFCVNYNRALTQYGISWNITMGLYWVRPNLFVNLDALNRKFLSDPDNISAEIASEISALKSPPSAGKYLDLCEKCSAELGSGKYEFKTFPELSYFVWSKSQKNAVPTTQTKPNIISTDNALGDADVSTVRYWLYAPGRKAVMWDEFYKQGIMGIGWEELGNLNVYTSKNEIRDKLCEINKAEESYMNSVHAVWQFAHEIKKGDVIFIKYGKSGILGRGIVESDYEYNGSKDYPNIRKVRWTHKGEWQVNKIFPVKTLTDITDYTDYVEEIKAVFDDETDEDDIGEVKKYTKYEKDDFLSEVYISSEEYDEINEVLHYKKNVIFQGAPGVGKTFLAKRLAYSLMGVKDIERVMMIQFHQSYSYEDFIMGFRPIETGFKLNEGPFYKFCNRAKIDSDNDYYFIIDEINRGNLSKIFGELFMLIENDKRGEKIPLLYTEEKFSVPKNVYLIGLMNTADRSLAMLDYALRRRFAFFDIKPAFSSKGFCEYRDGLNNPKFNALIECVKALNEKITEDESLGAGFCIGHSYFCNLKELTDKKLHEIVEYELIHILREYWFDEPKRVKEWSEKLRSSIQ